jgi:hypothetical protein
MASGRIYPNVACVIPPLSKFVELEDFKVAVFGLSLVKFQGQFFVAQIQESYVMPAYINRNS